MMVLNGIGRIITKFFLNVKSIFFYVGIIHTLGEFIFFPLAQKITNKALIGKKVQTFVGRGNYFRKVDVSRKR